MKQRGCPSSAWPWESKDGNSRMKGSSLLGRESGGARSNPQSLCFGAPRKIANTEPAFGIRPGSYGLPSGCRSEFGKGFHAVFIRIFCGYEFSFIEDDAFSGKRDALLAAAHEMHFDS